MPEPWSDEPRVLLLDEPTSGLEEAEARRARCKCVHALRHETKCAVLLVEHDIPFIMKECDRIVVLNLGRVLAQGTPEAIQANDEVRTAYLGHYAPSESEGEWSPEGPNARLTWEGDLKPTPSSIRWSDSAFEAQLQSSKAPLSGVTRGAIAVPAIHEAPIGKPLGMSVPMS